MFIFYFQDCFSIDTIVCDFDGNERTDRISLSSDLPKMSTYQSCGMGGNQDYGIDKEIHTAAPFFPSCLRTDTAVSLEIVSTEKFSLSFDCSKMVAGSFCIGCGKFIVIKSFKMVGLIMRVS